MSDRKRDRNHKRRIPRLGGYAHCACRDCFDIAISDHGEPVLCHDCMDAGCSIDSDRECDRADAYGCEEMAS